MLHHKPATSQAFNTFRLGSQIGILMLQHNVSSEISSDIQVSVQCLVYRCYNQFSSDWCELQLRPTAMNVSLLRVQVVRLAPN